MVLNISILEKEWNFYNTDVEEVLSSRESINTFLTFFLAGYFKSMDDIRDTIITLPKTLTKQERYKFHRYTIGYTFYPQSRDVENDRVMDLHINKNYLLDIFKNYEFNKETEPEEEEVQTPAEVALKTDKDILFETLLEFIEKNLSEQFENYLKNL